MAGFTVINPAVVQKQQEERPDNSPRPVTSKQTYRRPQTDNSLDFWYCDEEKWQSMLSSLDAVTAAKDKQGRKSALNLVRKYELVGRLMETDQGIDAVVPCTWCEDSARRCVIDKDIGGSCAWCKRNGRGITNCTAKATVSPSPDLNDATAPDDRPSMEEFLELQALFARMDKRVVDMGERIITLEEEGRSLRRALTLERHKRISGDLDVLRKSHDIVAERYSEELEGSERDNEEGARNSERSLSAVQGGAMPARGEDEEEDANNLLRYLSD